MDLFMEQFEDKVYEYLNVWWAHINYLCYRLYYM
jgi:hypothetical protein